MDNFIRIPFIDSNLDRYIARKSILDALTNKLGVFSGRLLDAGCGKMPYRDYILANSKVETYIGLDIETALPYDAKVKPDFTWDGKKMPFENERFENAMATEVLEHCPEPEVFLKEIYRVLKADGVFFFTVPFLWNLHEIPNDQYRYTPFSLERHLKNSGFKNIQIHSMGGWHAAMAQMMGLWVRRSGLRRIPKYLLSLLFMPVIKMLLRMDRQSNKSFKEGSMITGLFGTAKK